MWALIFVLQVTWPHTISNSVTTLSGFSSEVECKNAALKVGEKFQCPFDYVCVKVKK